MADYGHELTFGTFLTPQNRRPDQVVALAQLSEQAGLDLVTFQDHPYQPGFLDAWTLLTWVAANTERVKVSGNVLNLPLRQPAVLARAAASLDLLSGGRFELGLGAGGFWDPIVAMGGPRRTPAEAVEALSEALDVIKAIWDHDERGGVRVAGTHYRVQGAKRGPAPAHDIQIWLGALKPKMLRLIGAKADGWLPSLFYLKDGDLARGNRIIDEAAREAGRDPREIRRLLNVGPDTGREQLIELALEHGVSTFILATDDPAEIEKWGTETAPALREAVARERGGTEEVVVRGPKALAARRSGLNYDAVPPSLRATAVEPGDKAYPKVRSTYMRTGSPGLVLRPGSEKEVAEAIGFAREHDVPLAIRSGGHGISGLSTNDGGIVIDLGALNRVEVGENGLVRVGPGARWGDVAAALHPHGLAMSSGDYGDVGVGGLATAGGIGFLGRRYGLTLDHVTAADLVLADGSIVTADDDLLWGVRGAGANFGVVTALELSAYPLRDVVYATMMFDATDTAGLVKRWGELVETAPRELTSFLYLFAQRGGAPVARAIIVYASADTDAAVRVLTPFLQIAPVLDQQAQLAPYAAIVAPQDSPHTGGQTHPLISNGFAVHLTDEIGDLLGEGLRSHEAPWVSIRAVGGAVNDVDPMATAFAHRTANFNVSSVGGRRAAFTMHWDVLRKHLDGLYLSFETDRRPERLHDAFPGETLTRLRELKRKYDPDNVFNQNFPIDP